MLALMADLIFQPRLCSAKVTFLLKPLLDDHDQTLPLYLLPRILMSMFIRP